MATDLPGHPQVPRRRHPRARRWPLRLLTLALAGVVWMAATGSAAQATTPVADWVRKTATPLATTDPDAPLDDLAPLRAMVGDAAIVGLGESTHGAREIFQLKHRVLRFLVEEMGFRSIAWEEDWTTGLKVNRYILTGEGDLDTLMRQLSTTWQSPEVAEVLRWLRDYNASHEDKVRFTGVEFFATGLPAYDGVAEYVAEVAPEQVPALQEHLRPIRPRSENIGEHVGWYLRQPDKQPYIRHARQVYELVKGLPHAKGDRDWALAVHHARQILSFYEYFSLPDGIDYRDERSSQNLRWWRQRTGDKVVYWAAGVHTANAPGLRVSFQPPEVARWDSAGSHLRRWYGEKYRSIGFTFDHGRVNAGFGQPPYTPKPFPVPRPPRGWAERPLGDAGLDQFVLDLRGDAPPAVREWRESPTTTRVIGPNFDPRNPNAYHMSGGSLAQWFDVLIHRQVVTPWKPL